MPKQFANSGIEGDGQYPNPPSREAAEQARLVAEQEVRAKLALIATQTKESMEQTMLTVNQIIEELDVRERQTELEIPIREEIKRTRRIEGQQESRNEAMRAAIVAEDLTALTKALEGGAEVNAQGVNGVTALHLAVISMNDKMVNLLLKYGANCKLIWSALGTPLDLIKKSSAYKQCSPKATLIADMLEMGVEQAEGIQSEVFMKPEDRQFVIVFESSDCIAENYHEVTYLTADEAQKIWKMINCPEYVQVCMINNENIKWLHDALLRTFGSELADSDDEFSLVQRLTGGCSMKLLIQHIPKPFGEGKEPASSRFRNDGYLSGYLPVYYCVLIATQEVRVHQQMLKPEPAYASDQEKCDALRWRKEKRHQEYLEEARRQVELQNQALIAEARQTLIAKEAMTRHGLFSTETLDRMTLEQARILGAEAQLNTQNETRARGNIIQTETQERNGIELAYRFSFS